MSDSPGKNTKGYEYGGLSIFLGLFAILYAISWLPEVLQPKGGVLVHRLTFYFFLCLAIYRLLACVFLYVSAFNVMQWFFCALSVFLFFSTFVVLEGLAFPRGRSEQSSINVQKAVLRLIITSPEKVTLTRTMYFKPRENLPRVPDLDFYTNGRFSFKGLLLLKGGTTERAGPERYDSTFEGYLWYRGLLDIKNFEKGKVYSWQDTMEYTPESRQDLLLDSGGAKLFYTVNYPIENLEIEVNFEGPLRYEKDSTRFMILKNEGFILNKPQRVEDKSIKESDTEKKLTVKREHPDIKVGDLYGLFWKYKPDNKPVDSSKNSL